METEYVVKLDLPHPKQREFIDSPAPRKIIRAGRRGGKTRGLGILAVSRFLCGRRVLYAAPTTEQIQAFWKTVTRALAHPLKEKVLYKNETEHLIEFQGSECRIRAKTAWNADTLRGDYADDLILDEFQLMDEDAWGTVGAPMLLDNNGNAVFAYTPPSLHSRSVSKARDPQHAAKMFAKAKEWKAKENGECRWETFHFTSMDNPHISKQALEEITQDMTSLSYRMEILAEDVNEAPGALWKREFIDKNRTYVVPDLSRIVVAIDPSVTKAGDETGIIVAGELDDHGYVLSDRTIQGSPLEWAQEAVAAYHAWKADLIVAEANNGGEMVELTIQQADPNVPVKLVHASRGKATRAEPIAAKAEKGNIHHAGKFDRLEDELCLWLPGDLSPNRLDAMVWAFTELMLSGGTPGLTVLRRGH